MQINGIDLDGLASQVERVNIPPPVTGRVVHIDADFLAYQCSADSSGTKTWDDMTHNASVAVDTIKSLAGAEQVHLHLTPKGSDKGQRYEIALLKEYQGNRQDKEKPRYLDLMRDHLGTHFPATLHMNCEADDGMSGAQYASIRSGAWDQCIIASKDKDLRMVPGLQLDWDTGEINCTDPREPFGTIYLHERRSSSGVLVKSVKGYGQKMFWAQMLMGDTADNISGLPLVCGPVLNKIEPTKQSQLWAAAAMGPDGPKKQAALVKLAERSKKVGPVLTHKLLDPLTSNIQCFAAVKALYRVYGETFGFSNWKTGEPVPWQHAFMSEAKLLWMRRTGSNPDCVIQWFKEISTQ